MKGGHGGIGVVVCWGWEVVGSFSFVRGGCGIGHGWCVCLTCMSKCSLATVQFCSLCWLVGWLVVCGIGGTIAQSVLDGHSLGAAFGTAQIVGILVSMLMLSGAM